MKTGRDSAMPGTVPEQHQAQKPAALPRKPVAGKGIAPAIPTISAIRVEVVAITSELTK